MNLMMLLEMAAEGFGRRVAVQNEGDRLTYAELFEAAGQAASLFGGDGVSHAALLDVNSLALPVALFASSWCGIPFVPLSYRRTRGELEGLLARVAPASVVIAPEQRGTLSTLEGVTVRTRQEFFERFRSLPRRPADWGMDPESIAVLLFTSGTTGAPKAAVLRQKHLVSYVIGSVEFGSAQEDEATLVSVPPYHIAGIAAIATSIYAGRRIVQLASFDARAWVETARRERVTNAFVVPTMLARIVAELEREGRAELPSLRALSYGGGKMPLPVIEKAMALLPRVEFTNAYGLTETSSTISILGPEDHRAAMQSEDPRVRRRLASVGRPIPSVEVEIRDAKGRRLAPGERGEIHVRGPQVSGEYLERTRLDPEGWFPTRDGGWMDEDGYLFLEGRVDDVIVRGGENISPGEVEEVLLEHEAVADCAVVGIPDEQWGENVAAAVVLEPGRSAKVEELQEWVRARLRSSRTPVRIEFWSELPYNELGKLLRRRVREELLGREA